MRREEEGVRDDAQASAPGSAFTWWGHSARACFTLTQSQDSKVEVRDSGNIPIKAMQFYGGAIWQSESKTRHTLMRKHEWVCRVMKGFCDARDQKMGVSAASCRVNRGKRASRLRERVASVRG